MTQSPLPQTPNIRPTSEHHNGHIPNITMRLIDTQTHLLLEPWKAAGKEYAILSHTWGDQEVIFQEWEQLYPSGAIKGQCPHVRHQGIDQKAGYHKVMQACEQARRDGIRYLWCDTMCINKESSAELSEAINSML